MKIPFTEYDIITEYQIIEAEEKKSDMDEIFCMIIKSNIEPLDIPKNNKYVLIGMIYKVIDDYEKGKQ